MIEITGGTEIKAVSLEPGKTYVIHMERRIRTKEDYLALQRLLARAAPECKFLVLDAGMRLLTNREDIATATGSQDAQ